jgi:hypothetical protein
MNEQLTNCSIKPAEPKLCSIEKNQNFTQEQLGDLSRLITRFEDITGIRLPENEGCGVPDVLPSSILDGIEKVSFDTNVYLKKLIKRLDYVVVGLVQ